MSSQSGRRYLFAPLERRGLLLGLGAGQLGAVAGSVLAAVATVHARPDVTGAAIAVLVLVAGGVTAVLPVGGKPVAGWAPVAGAWAARRLRGAALNEAPRAGWPRAGLRGARSGHPLVPGVDVGPAPSEVGQPELGVIRDRSTGAWSAILPVRGKAFALLDPADKERRLAAWGAVLAGLGRPGSPIYRVQWVERTFAGDGDALVGALGAMACPEPTGAHGALAGSVPAGAPRRPLPARAPEESERVTDEARAGYAELLRSAGPATVGHESLLVLAVHPRSAGRAGRSFGGGAAAMAGLLRREVRLLEGQLRSAELVTLPPLTAREVETALRSGLDPDARRFRPIGPLTSWPAAVEQAWSTARIDGLLHATFWVAEWPRTEVGADFLSPLLLSGCGRSVSVTMAPVPAERARRQVEAARTAEAADEELRRRAGFLATARRQRESEGVARREAELADGHAEYRFSGYVTVSGSDPDALEAACAEVTQVARQARLELRRLYGQQAEALTWTLPLARGLS